MCIKQTMKTLIRRLWCLIWVGTVCLCPKKGTPGEFELMPPFAHMFIITSTILAFKTSFYFISNDFLYLLVSKSLVTLVLSMVKYKLIR